MAGLYNGVSGLSGWSGLWGNVVGLWSGATGLADGSGSPVETFYFELEDGSGSLLLEDSSFLLLETA